MIYSSVCDDPNSMVILDLVTGITYTDEEAKRQDKDIRSRLVNHCTKQGFYVLTIEECKEIQLNDKRRK